MITPIALLVVLGCLLTPTEASSHDFPRLRPRAHDKYVKRAASSSNAYSTLVKGNYPLVVAAAGSTSTSTSHTSTSTKAASTTTVSTTKGTAISTTTSESTSASATSSTPSSSTKPKLVGSYLSDWYHTNLSTIPYSAFSELDFFAATTLPNPNSLGWTGFSTVGDELTYLQSFVSKIRSSNTASGAKTKGLLTLGGWGGSAYFSDLMSTAANRTAFAKTVSSTISKYGLDGVDLDWEYPNNYGNGNTYRAKDTTNFIGWLRELRRVMGTGKVISAAVSMTGFAGPDGSPITNATLFAEVFDYITIMNYDVAGTWNELTGANSPLSAACAPPQQAISAKTAIDYWTSVGFPASKIVLGVPTYGHTFNLTSSTLATTSYNGVKSQLYQKFNPAAADFNWRYNQLVDLGIITANGTAIKPYTRYWDNCTSTPFLFNPNTKLFITYDDPVSIAYKARFASQYNLGGIKFFDFAGDNGYLLQAARQALGYDTTLLRNACGVKGTVNLQTNKTVSS